MDGLCIGKTVDTFNEVWDGCYERDIEKFEKIQLEAARIVTGLTKFASKDSLYFETGWETLANWRETRK